MTGDAIYETSAAAWDDAGTPSAHTSPVMAPWTDGHGPHGCSKSCTGWWHVTAGQERRSSSTATNARQLGQITPTRPANKRTTQRTQI